MNEGVPQATGLSVETKYARREGAENDARLLERRFVLAEDPRVREKLERLKPAIAQLRQKFPQFIGVNLFGSQVRSYADTASDFDLVTFFDSTLEDASNRQEVIDEIKEGLGEALNATHFATDTGSSRFFVDTERVKSIVASPDYLDSDTALQVIPCLFFLSVGDGAAPLRKAVFDTLLRMGPEGEVRWRRIMEYVFERENDGWSEAFKEKRRELYPWTLAEARSYFSRSKPAKRKFLSLPSFLKRKGA